MIDARELRVGNWVYNDENNPVQIVVIEDELFAEWNGSDSNVIFIEAGSYRYSSINPIPLTPEILENAGFTYARPNSSVLQLKIAYNDTDYPCSLQVSGSGIQICRNRTSAICAPVGSLHQLQNLYFALTQQELTIKI